MKKRLGETDESLIRIKKPGLSEQQVALHWNMILAKIKPVEKETEQIAHLVKK